MQMPFQLTILGSSSATPTSQRYPTAQVLRVPGRSFLIDCGEGTQHQIRKNKINFSRIGHIFISHLHGDHFFGLIGLISSCVLLGRKSDLHIYAHSELQRYTRFQLDFLEMETGFKLLFHPLNFKKPQLIFEDHRLSVTSFPLIHRVPCCGFRFDEKPLPPNLIKEQLKKYQVPIGSMKGIKAGENFVTAGGEIIPNQILVNPARKPRSYAYCSDTAYSEKVAEVVKDADLLYHEATFAESDRKTAEETCHSTGMQAAQIAKLANAKRLLIGHFSGRYKSTDEILSEARAVFPATYVVNDNDVFDIGG